MVLKCSVIVRCYNEAEHINRLLTGIYRQNYALSNFLEVIVVDSGSTDDTVTIASHYPIKLLSIHKDEFSFGRALNVGCQEAIGEFIVIVSAHVYPIYQDWLERLLEPFIDPKVALVYGKQRGNSTTKYSESQIFAKWFPDEADFDQPHPFCNNANAAIRRSLWKQIPYDEMLTGLEDLDWAKKAQRFGYKLAYAADAVIVHVHDETPPRILNRYRREAIALKRIFPEEQFHLWDFIRLVVTNIISDLYHSWHDGVIWQRCSEICMFRLMQFLGTYRGFLHHGKITRKLRQTFYYPKGFSRPVIDADSTHKSPIDYSTSFDALQEKCLEKTKTH
ncbi:MAG: glycosyltransferase [Pegethrix bostrychoides GSE-TBD4-15B]|jgi:glycosyltransferase involved in cell wall biosynthesis|uniref:Glucosyl-3-phosphoglycerate synthase n=1 Tax=Pegethrix bostrychoides GSE-TBD4-15B TaxID=2839662 RepID=A0A951U322_9CYAN|nr:glycosyltransferase [Pegethrix bostrychoides GSE-TBD4-15B]